MSSPYSSGLVFLSTRISPPSSPDQSRRGQRATPPSSTRPSPPSSTPASSPPSPPLTPLTPHNTFVSRNGSITPEGFDFEIEFPSEHGSELDLSMLDEELLARDVSDSEYDLGDLDDKDDRPCDTRSEPSPDTSGSSNKTVIHIRPVISQRSKSVPARPLKSALVTSPPPSGIHDSDRCSRKKARFNEAELTEEFSFRDVSSEPDLVRTHTSPDRADLMRRILQRDSFSEHAQSFYTDSSGLNDDPELATAIELFDEVVEELVQVAEEHAEAHEQLAHVAHEVADAIFSRRSSRVENDAANVSVDNDRHQEERASMSGLMRQRSADEDVDESCIADPAIDSSQDDDHHSQPGMALWTDRGELQATQLVPINEDSDSSTGTLSDPGLVVSKVSNQRRASDSQTNLVNLAKLQSSRRRNSMTDFTKLKGRVKLLPKSPKASPAGCAVTACSVKAAESPKPNNVYAHPGARHMMFEVNRKPTKMAQTVRSDTGTFQVLWIEPPMSSSSSDVTLLDSSGRPVELFPPSEESTQIARTPSPMDKVKTKLAAWSWLREHGLDSEHGGPNWIPLLSCHDEISHSPPGMHSPPSDEPFAAPNTERQSGASSAKHSAPHSPGPEDLDTSTIGEDEEDHPLELKVKPSPACPASTTPPSLKKRQGDYLSLPVLQHRSKLEDDGSHISVKRISRELSNLPAEETHFKTHKDSLVLLHKHKEEGNMNQHLINSRASIILTRSKLDSQHPKSVPASKSARSSPGTLSTILDASPLDPRMEASLRAMEKFVEATKREEKQAQAKCADQSSSDDHVGCPICETEGPREFAAKCKKRHFV